MTALRSVLAKDPDEPICDACAKALGARPRDETVTVSPRPCCICDEVRGCAAIRDWHWPAANITTSGEKSKRRLHDDPDDYSELEGLLGRRE